MKRLLLFAAVLAGCSKDAPDNASQQPTPAPTAIGMPIGSPVTQSVNASGGTVYSPDSILELVIPPGALSSAVSISILPVANWCHGSVGPAAYRLTPDGQTFSVPVSLRFHPPESELAGTDLNALGIAFQRSDRTWTSFVNTTVDTIQHTIAVETRHFTDFSLYTSWLIDPSSASVATGGTVNLVLKHLEVIPEPPGPDGEELAPLVGTPVPANNYVQQIGNWTVNGNLLGNLIDGHVVPNNPNAVYHAPDEVPNVNPVAVAVEIQVPGRPRVHLVSNVEVTSTGHYRLEVWDNQLLNNVICYCEITAYYDISTAEFDFNPAGQVVVSGPITNNVPQFNYLPTPLAICNAVTYTMGTIHITAIQGQRTGDSLSLDLYLSSESPDVVSSMLGTPCNSPPSVSSNILTVPFNTVDTIQSYTTPLNAPTIRLTRLY